MNSQPVYRRVQFGWTLLYAFSFAVVFASTITLKTANYWVMGAVALGVIFTMVLFGSLTIEITDSLLHLRFGVGWINKSFPLEEIRSATPVRNRWYYGWGIRMTPHGWLYNVSGLDAVEITLTNGRSYRLGTDEPQVLAHAIRVAAHLPPEPA